MPERGSFDREKLNELLDEAFLCHVAFVADGEPFIIPTSYCRIADEIVLHGSSASRVLRVVGSGQPICVCVTSIEALVLARSPFHHSMNYRSAVIFGTARLIEGREDKFSALRALSEHIVPGRWEEVRKPTDRELKATSIVAVPLTEYSVKTRTGPPLDDQDDYKLPIWAGVLPLESRPGEAIPDVTTAQTIEVPNYLRQYSRKVQK